MPAWTPWSEKVETRLLRKKAASFLPPSSQHSIFLILATGCLPHFGEEPEEAAVAVAAAEVVEEAVAGVAAEDEEEETKETGV